MNKRAVALALIAVFAVTAIGAVVVAITGGDDGDVVAGPEASTPTTATLNDQAQELVDRLVAARKRQLHLTYTGGLAATPETGKLTVEIWWDGALTRQDVTTEAPAGKQEQSSFALPSGNVACIKGGDGAWACQRSASSATAGKPSSIIDSLVAQLNGKPVTAAKARVGDTDADCYTLDPATEDVVCLRADGVPVKFTLSGSELVATSVVTDVDDDDFRPPAEPSELPSTPTTPTSGG